MNINNIFNQENLAAIVEICEAIETVAEETAHTHHIPKMWHEGDVSMHRIGSELCRLARKGKAKRCNVSISPKAQCILTWMIELTGHDTGHHSDHTYREIASKMSSVMTVLHETLKAMQQNI